MILKNTFLTLCASLLVLGLNPFTKSNIAHAATPNDLIAIKTDPVLKDPRAKIFVNTDPVLKDPRGMIAVNTDPVLSDPKGMISVNTDPVLNPKNAFSINFQPLLDLIAALEKTGAKVGTNIVESNGLTVLEVTVNGNRISSFVVQCLDCQIEFEY